MRITKQHLEAKVQRLNKMLNRPMSHWQKRTEPIGPLVSNPGNFHIGWLPGNKNRLFQLMETTNVTGGVRVVGNHTSFGAADFADFLQGIIEGIELQRESKQVTESDYMLAHTLRMLCNGPNGSETKRNPYGVKAIEDALRFLASKHGITEYLDAAEIVIRRYQSK